MNTTEIIGIVIGVLIAVILAAILNPLLYAAGGYLTGWVLYQLFTFAGEWVVGGLGHLGVEVGISALPQIGAALGFVGAFFKATQKNENKS